MRPAPRALSLLALSASLLALCPACGAGGPAEPSAEPQAASAAARWVRVRPPGDLSVLEAPARVVSSTVAQGEVAATAPARVLRVHVAPGQTVEAGTPIVDLVMPTVLQAAAAWIAASRQLGVHRGRQSELESLRGEGLVEETQVFQQTARVAELSAEQAAALAVLHGAGVSPSEVSLTLRRGYVTLGAPIAGVVRELDAHVGEVRDVGAPPFARILGTATPRIEVRAGQPMPAGAEARFEGMDGTSLALGGALTVVIDPIDGAYVSWLDPTDPAARAADGLRGVVRWAVPEGSAVEIPAAAIRMEPGRTVVFRRHGDAIEPVEVQVVTASGASAIVRGPLTLEDRVAADAATVLRAPEEGEDE